MWNLYELCRARLTAGGNVLNVIVFGDTYESIEDQFYMGEQVYALLMDWA